MPGRDTGGRLRNYIRMVGIGLTKNIRFELRLAVDKRFSQVDTEKVLNINY